MLLPAAMLLSLILSIGGCSCGFDCSGNDDTNSNDDPALLTLGFSDSLPEDLKEVVIEVDSITFTRSGADPKVVDTFSFGGAGTQTFTVDLLRYPGASQFVVIENLELDAGTYEVSIAILDGDVNKSNVLEAIGVRRPLTVSGGVLTLQGMALASGNQEFTVEFGLAQALQFQSASNTYLLAPNGIRIVNNLTDATLSGTIDSTLFDTVSPCSEKNPPTSGNRVYLYKGIDLTQDLADVFTSASVPRPPDNALAPFAVASLNAATREYAFGFVPAGDYTLAFACDTAKDDAVVWNDLTIPLPVDQVYEISLSAGEKAVCNLNEEASCEAGSSGSL
jgi:Domain of unknown function (DUF4382)